jgi:hypothetical protein
MAFLFGVGGRKKEGGRGSVWLREREEEGGRRLRETIRRERGESEHR